MDRVRTSERGQVIVVLVLAFVVLLGLTALAIDGGMVYADRRHAQNAADAASLAGGNAAGFSLENNFVNYDNFTCTNNGRPEYDEVLQAMAAARTAAVNRAASNGVIIDQDMSDQHGVAAACAIENTAGRVEKYLVITTTITVETQTSFAHLVYNGPLRNTVQAVARVTPRSPLGYGNAIVALNTADCQGHQNGATFHGNATVTVEGGGIFSNGCLRANGGPTVQVTNGSINYVAQVIGESAFQPVPQLVQLPMLASDFEIPAPDCSHPSANNVPASSLLNTVQPLRGLYCVTGNLRVNGNDTLIGEEVTIYMLDGGIRINGNATVRLSAPPSSPNPEPAVAGLLFYLPPTNSNDVQLNGNEHSYFIGTVFAPRSNIDVLGTGQTEAYHSQVIGWNVEVGGTADTFVLYNGGEQYSRPALLDLYR